MITYKGKEIDDDYLFNIDKEEIVYEGVNNYETLDLEEFKDIYDKAVLKEKGLTDNGVEHTPVHISIAADSGNDYSDDFMEISLTWNERESEAEHNRRIERAKKIIDKKFRMYLGNICFKVTNF
jgi:hypothetical protein